MALILSVCLCVVILLSLNILKYLNVDVYRDYRVLQGCLMGVSKVFQGSFKSVSRMFYGCFNDVSRMFYGCFNDVSMMFQ